MTARRRLVIKLIIGVILAAVMATILWVGFLYKYAQSMDASDVVGAWSGVVELDGKTTSSTLLLMPDHRFVGFNLPSVLFGSHFLPGEPVVEKVSGVWGLTQDGLSIGPSISFDAPYGGSGMFAAITFTRRGKALRISTTSGSLFYGKE